jgi:transcriptional regulator with XRE-family HTH domain
MGDILPNMGEPATADMGPRLASRLAELRSEHDWSLEDLAGRTGMSRSTVSRLERGEISPTTTQLGRLAAAYQRTMSRLLAEVESPPAHLVRAAEQVVWRDETSGFARRLVSPPHADLRGELTECQLRPGGDISDEAPSAAGLEQHVWVLSGSLEFTSGDEVFLLVPGDCLRLRVWGRTRLRCLSADPVRYAMFVVTP